MSASSASPINIERFQGGQRLMVGGGVAGLVLLVISLIGIAIDPTPALYSYLVAFAYWCGIAIAFVVLLLIMHTFKARWVTVLRRAIEIPAVTIGLFVILAIPIVIGMKHIYSWVNPSEWSVWPINKEALELIHHKHAYLNPTFFIVRLAIYFLVWIFLAERVFGWSKRQDTAGDLEAIELTQKQRNLSPPGLPFMALTFSFAAFDWLMSLTPTWFSTIFGVYFFAGSFVAALSVISIVTFLARDKNLFGQFMSVEHTHSVGKLMLAFTCFWTYIAFSQLLLIWIAGLPEEVPFYITRIGRGWAWMGILLIVGHFFVPFGALLSRSLKRDPRRLALVGVWILFIHYVDIFWLVMPTLNPEGFTMHWTHVTSFLGIGLLAVAFGVWRLRGQFAVPVRDPYLAESLRYRQP